MLINYLSSRKCVKFSMNVRKTRKNHILLHYPMNVESNTIISALGLSMFVKSENIDRGSKSVTLNSRGEI